MELQPGDRIQKYVIKRRLCGGAFGIVYQATDPVLGDVAIKELRYEWLANEQIRKRFLHEAQIQRDLEHPNIVTIYNFLDPSTDQVDNYYMIMKFMVGGSLEELIRQKQTLPIREALEIVLCVGKALEAAHKQNIIHRDIKPDNILLGTPGDVRLTDFGIAHIPRVRLTPGGQPGTLYWQSPEQAKNMTRIDGRSDLYSLSAVLYRLVTGRLYLDFEECTAKAMECAEQIGPRDMGQHIQKHICNLVENSHPVLPSTYRSDVPAQLDVQIIKGLAKKREDRFDNASQMIQQLEQVIKILETDTLENKLQKARLRIEEARFDKAEEIIKQVLKKEPDNADALELMGDIYHEQLDYKLAIETWEKVKAAQPDRLTIYSRLGKLYNKVSRFDKAAHTFREGLNTHSDNPLFLHGLSAALWGMDERHEAIKLLELSCKLDPNESKQSLLGFWRKTVGNEAED